MPRFFCFCFCFCYFLMRKFWKIKSTHFICPTCPSKFTENTCVLGLLRRCRTGEGNSFRSLEAANCFRKYWPWSFDGIEFSRNYTKLAFWYCFNFAILMDIVVSYLNFNSRYHDKCTFVVKLIPLVSTSNLFPLEVAQKCQLYQLCVLQENSNIYASELGSLLSFSL